MNRLNTTFLTSATKSGTMGSSVLPVAIHLIAPGTCWPSDSRPIPPPWPRLPTLRQLLFRHLAVRIVIPASSFSSKPCRLAAVILYDDHYSN